MPVYSFFSTKKYKKSEILFISCKSYHVIVIKSILIFSLVSITNFTRIDYYQLPVLNLDILLLWLEINTFSKPSVCNCHQRKNLLFIALSFFYFYVPESDMLWICLLILFAMPSSTSRYYVKNKFWSSIRIKLIISDWLERKLDLIQDLMQLVFKK